MRTGAGLRLERDGARWIAEALETGGASQGPPRAHALETLDEALERTREATDADTEAPTPDAPWFDAS